MQIPIKKPKLSDCEKYSQRFIPNRASSNLISSFDKIQQDSKPFEFWCNENYLAYSVLLQRQFLNSPIVNPNLFKFSRPTGKENQFFDFSTPEFYSPLISPRKIPKCPYKVLDAPTLADDFYLNLLDWSFTNQLIVALGSIVYIWDANTSKVRKLCDLGNSNPITSVSSSLDGQYLSIGTNSGMMMLWDLCSNKLSKTFNGHTSRIGCLCWNNSIISSGSRDRQVINRDIRMPTDVISRLNSHKQEICGLKWSFDYQQLASGGNDNKIMLWNLHSNQPIYKFSQHTAAVKALAWSPHKYSLLVSGGGSADKTIRYWNTSTNEELMCIDTGSQVCNLLFSKNTSELVSTHGFSLNQINVWKDYNKIGTLSGHTLRVLYLAISPDGRNIVTGAGDETLRFWDLFPYNQFQNKESNQLLLSAFDIR